VTKLDEAIANFPIITWIAEHTTVFDKGRVNTYADCPICEGKKTLGIERDKKIFHCFRCNEGGYGGSIWNGKAHLVKMIMLLERKTFSQTREVIFKLAGYPDVIIEQAKAPKAVLPSEAISLATAHPSDPAIQYLNKREVGHLKNTSYICLSGHYANRIIFPTVFLGEVTGFEAKQIGGKSLFPDWMDTYSTVYTTLNFNPAIGLAVVTESIIDAETLNYNGIGLFGGFKEGQLECLLKLRDKGVKKLVWMMDWDAWYKQAKAILAKTMNLFDNYVVNFPKDEDPNSLGTVECYHLLGSARKISDEFDLVKASLDFGRIL